MLTGPVNKRVDAGDGRKVDSRQSAGRGPLVGRQRKAVRPVRFAFSRGRAKVWWKSSFVSLAPIAQHAAQLERIGRVAFHRLADDFHDQRGREDLCAARDVRGDVELQQAAVGGVGLSGAAVDPRHAAEVVRGEVLQQRRVGRGRDRDRLSAAGRGQAQSSKLKRRTRLQGPGNATGPALLSLRDPRVVSSLPEGELTIRSLTPHPLRPGSACYPRTSCSPSFARPVPAP